MPSMVHAVLMVRLADPGLACTYPTVGFSVHLCLTCHTKMCLEKQPTWSWFCKCKDVVTLTDHVSLHSHYRHHLMSMIHAAVRLYSTHWCLQVSWLFHHQIKWVWKQSSATKSNELGKTHVLITSRLLRSMPIANYKSKYPQPVERGNVELKWSWYYNTIVRAWFL